MSGISAASGAACAMMKIGEASHSALSDRPMAMPIAMPKTAEMTSPRTSGCSVMPKALISEKSASIDQRPAMVSPKVGKAGLIGKRPAHSHARQRTIAESSLSVSG